MTRKENKRYRKLRTLQKCTYILSPWIQFRVSTVTEHWNVPNVYCTKNCLNSESLAIRLWILIAREALERLSEVRSSNCPSKDSRRLNEYFQPFFIDTFFFTPTHPYYFIFIFRFPCFHFPFSVLPMGFYFIMLYTVCLICMILQQSLCPPAGDNHCVRSCSVLSWESWCHHFVPPPH